MLRLTVLVAFLVLALPVTALAQSCPPGVARIVELVPSWSSHISEKIRGERLLPALQQFKTQSERLSLLLDDVKDANHLLGHFDPYFDELLERSGPDVMSNRVEKMLLWADWAANSFSGMANCMALAPVDVDGIGQVSLGGLISLMRYVDAEMFDAQLDIDATLRFNGSGDREEFIRLMRALGTINWFVERSGGSFTLCSNDLAASRSRGQLFRLRPHFAGDQEMFAVSLGPRFSTMTLFEARSACYSD